MESGSTYTAFLGSSLFASGSLAVVLPRLKAEFERDRSSMVLVFEDRTGKAVDFDLRGTVDEVLARYLPSRTPGATAPEPEVTRRSGPGRPRLGVVPREVTLLPRHWEWLESQPNGASAALRRLVDEARAREPEKQRSREAIEAAGRFLSAMAGNLTNYEEVTRALWARERGRFEELMADWPEDVRAHSMRLIGEAL